MSDEVRYGAFISYSHRDARWASWLQRSLERYRVPRRLVGSDGAHGPVPPRVGRVFRDREEFAAGAELSDSVQAALRASRFLVVVCSPAAAASSWANEEILRFKRLHGATRILCLIVDGDPAAEDENACFPTSLRLALDEEGQLTDQRVEPLAADVRPGGDGKRLARQKLLAGLLGLPLDALRQREQQRRQRILAGVTAASLAGMAFTGWLAWTAMLAREDAERRQLQAEALVEFMLSDLHDGLRKVGRLDIMQATAQEARGYFASLELRDLTVTSLQGHAEALRQLGDLQLRQGEPGEAYQAFQEAWRMDRELLDRSPDDPQRLFNLGQSEFWRGYARLESGEVDIALTHFRAYMDISRRLYERDPERVEWVMELCYAHNNLASVLAGEGRTDVALDHMRDAVRYNLEALALAPEDPDLRMELAISEGWLGTVLRESGDLEAALPMRESSRRGWEAAHEADPTDAATRIELAIGLRKEGDLLIALGQQSPALAAMDQAAVHLQALIELDADNTLWGQEWLGLLTDRFLVLPQEPQYGRMLLEATRNLGLAMAADPPETPAYRLRLARVLAAAATADSLNDEWMAKALTLADGAMQQSPGDQGHMHMQAEVVTLGVQAGASAARPHAERLLTALRALDPAPDDPLRLSTLLALQLAAQPESLREDWLAQLWSTGFRHPRFLDACSDHPTCAASLPQNRMRGQSKGSE